MATGAAGWLVSAARTYTHADTLNIKLWITPRYMLERMREEQGNKEDRRTEGLDG